MSATLYRKYRPRKFSDVIGQQAIVRTLSNAVKYNRVGQAYLFAGPRGTGKTTLARILAMAVNCANLSSEERADNKLSVRRSEAKANKLPSEKQTAEPCFKCDACRQISQGKSLDIIEIDAASNTGVDNIRELRETVKLPPAQAKYKVYIIDEVHMLSIGAFNALLKTLEEPPEHVIFILATTEIHKLPETILSRCQRFDFSRLSLENIIKKLALIAKSEKVKIEKAALEMIAMAAEGGMRDAESLLSQIMSLEDKNITSKEVEEILGTTNRQPIEQMVDYLLQGKTSSALKLTSQLTKDGYDLEIFSKSLLNYFRQLMLIAVNPETAKSFSFELTSEQIKKMETLARKSPVSEILKIIDLISEAKDKIKSSFIPQLPLEMAIVKIGREENPPSFSETNPPTINPSSAANRENPPQEKISPPEPKSAEVETKQSAKIIKPKIEPDVSKNIDKISDNNKQNPDSKKSEVSLDNIKENWKNILIKVESLNHSISSILAGCQPIKIENNIIVIATKYGFYKDRLNENKNKKAIEDIVSDILKFKINIEILTEEESGVKLETADEKPSEKKGTQSNLLLSDAMEMMGGKIVE
ncbi:DNA polymerase III subunit gamma/tau [bacterium]|nr:DNA polymerase III subunit gamma/tau [bacterium]